MPTKFVGAIGVILTLTVATLGVPSDASAISVSLSPRPQGVACDEIVKGAGNVLKNPKVLTCIVEPPPGATTTSGLVACGNPGSKLNPAPGIQFVEFSGTFEAFNPIDPKSCEKNGTCTQTVIAKPTGNQLAAFEPVCDAINPNWSAIDFTPCAMTVTAQVIGLCGETNEVVQAQIKLSCVMLNCESSITWDKATQTFTGPPYSCTTISSDPNLNRC